MSKKNPNPDGKKGGEKHQKLLEEIVEDIEKRNGSVYKEYPVATPKGIKRSRLVDVANLGEGDLPVEFHQVGKVNSDGKPVKREQEAIEDIEKHSLFNIKVQFHAYNKDSQ